MFLRKPYRTLLQKCLVLVIICIKVIYYESPGWRNCSPAGWEHTEDDFQKLCPKHRRSLGLCEPVFLFEVIPSWNKHILRFKSKLPLISLSLSFFLFCCCCRNTLRSEESLPASSIQWGEMLHRHGDGLPAAPPLWMMCEC